MYAPFLLAFAILPLTAQDRFQIALDVAYQGSSTQHENFISISANQRTQSGLEVGWRPLSLGPVDIRLTAGMRAKSSSDVTVGAYYRSDKIGTLSHESIDLGAEATWHRGVELGGGLQVRRERMTLSMTDATVPDASATIYRPWLTSHVGFSWKIQKVTPFFRGLLSIPLTEEKYTSESDVVVPSEQLVKAMAPSVEIGVQVGLRF